MRLLYLSADPGVPVFGGKGASIHVRSMAGAFAQLGHEVILLSPRIEPGADELASSIRCLEIPAVRPRGLPTEAAVENQIGEQSQAVVRLARRERVDAIYERYSLASCAGARAARALGIPLVVEVNAPLRLEEQRFRHLAHEPVAVRAEQETFAASSLVVAVSDWLADWLATVGIPAGRIAVIPNPPPRELLALRRDLGTQETVAVGFAGSLKPWHGLATLVDGFRAALSAGARMRLEIAGDGPMATALDAAVGDAEGIRRLGHLPHRDLLSRLATWDIGIAPYSSLEGFYFSPLKLAEYMAAGLCPVVSRVGPLPALVEHGSAGVVVAPDDPEALAEALLALDRDRPWLRSLGSRAQAIAAQQPTWTEIAGRLAGVLGGPVPADVAVG